MFAKFFYQCRILKLTNVLAVSMNFVYENLFSGTELLHILNTLETCNLFLNPAVFLDMCTLCSLVNKRRSLALLFKLWWWCNCGCVFSRLV